MIAIAEQLDATLRSLDSKAASSLEKLVRDALELADVQKGGSRHDRLPAVFLRASPTSLAPNLSNGLRKARLIDVRTGDEKGSVLVIDK